MATLPYERKKKKDFGCHNLFIFYFFKSTKGSLLIIIKIKTTTFRILNLYFKKFDE